MFLYDFCDPQQLAQSLLQIDFIGCRKSLSIVSGIPSSLYTADVYTPDADGDQFC